MCGICDAPESRGEAADSYPSLLLRFLAPCGPAVDDELATKAVVSTPL